MEEIERTANELLGSLEKKDRIDKVTRIRQADPFEELKGTLIDFFKGRIRVIMEQEGLKNIIKDSLRADLENGELSFNQKMQFLKQVTGEESMSADSLLGLFKPTPGAPSILASNLSKTVDSQDLIEAMYESMDSNDLERIEALSRFIDKVAKDKREGVDTEG